MPCARPPPSVRDRNRAMSGPGVAASSTPAAQKAERTPGEGRKLMVASTFRHRGGDFGAARQRRDGAEAERRERRRDIGEASRRERVAAPQIFGEERAIEGIPCPGGVDRLDPVWREA